MKILEAPRGGDFTILNLTDPQLGDSEWDEGQPAGKLLTDTVTRLVEMTRPDLITVSGDIAWSANFVSYRRFTELMESFGLPWAPVLGNHDQEHCPEVTEKEIDVLLTGKNCLFERGDPKLGWGNYVLAVGFDGKPAHGIIFMDSHSYVDYTPPGGQTYAAWAEIWPEQIEWYRDRIKELSELGVRESSIITHIPLYPFRDAVTAAYRPDVDLKAVPPRDGEQTGIWNPGYGDVSFGVMYEPVCSYPEDNGFFDVIRDLGNTKTFVCGHDHINTFSTVYRGVRLAYAVKTGSGCYWDERINGGTVLKIAPSGRMTVKHIVL